ncbi:hypothetical protein [Kordia sp.]|uniref:hypothetical protein n=1 Tax=Kordia sp. TaxID=1965332 RepID=UPI003D2D1A80
MNNLNIIFHKTITIATILEHDLLHSFLWNASDQVETNEAFYQHTLRCFQGSKHLEMITQILTIEQEKFALSDPIDEKILCEYSNYNLEREIILQLPLVALKKIKLQQSTYISCYASDWKFVFFNETDQGQLLNKILEFPKDEYYFVFQCIDVFDDVLQTNVLEFHLTKYEYYILQLFEKTKSVASVMDDFIAVFDVESEEELNSLVREMTRIIKFLIFRKFIVKPSS